MATTSNQTPNSKPKTPNQRLQTKDHRPKTIDHKPPRRHDFLAFNKNYFMLWQGRRESGNVEDRRGMSGGMVAGGGIGAVIVGILYFLLGGNPSDLPTG